MAKAVGRNNKSVRSTDISVEERIARYNSAVQKIKSSPGKTKAYLKSTGIYTESGNLTKAYK